MPAADVLPNILVLMRKVRRSQVGRSGRLFRFGGVRFLGRCNGSRLRVSLQNTALGIGIGLEDLILFVFPFVGFENRLIQTAHS